MDEQERRVLHALAAAVDVRPLVGGQVLDKPFPQGLENLSQVGLSVGFFGWAGELLADVSSQGSCHLARV
jgi:hypothetical protein